MAMVGWLGLVSLGYGCVGVFSNGYGCLSGCC